MQQALHRTAAAWAILGGVLLFAIVGVTVTNVAAFTLDRLAELVDRDVTGLPGYEDFVRLTISSAALMLFPYCQARRGHVAVDILAETVMPRRVQGVLDAIWQLLIVVLAGFLAWKMTLGMLETYGDHALSRVLGWPVWPFYLPGIASLLLWAAVALADLRPKPVEA